MINIGGNAYRTVAEVRSSGTAAWSKSAGSRGATGHLVEAQLGYASDATRLQAHADLAAVDRGSQKRALQILR